MHSVHDSCALEDYGREHRLDRHHLKQLRNSFFKKQCDVGEALSELPEGTRQEFARNFNFHFLKLHSRTDSAVDGATKLIFETDAGFLIESVLLRIESGRTSLCVSTQVGCAVRCGFCATGSMGMARNLTADEILGQVIQANQLLKAENRSVRNVVFMGMGEPLHNENALHQAIESLCSPRSFGLSPRRILVSTVGIPAAMLRLADRFPEVGIALSLHCARQETREQIIPLAKHYRLDELRDVLEFVAAKQNRAVMIEYLMLKHLTDTEEDLLALQEFVRGLPVHINLIPYNRIEGAPKLEGTEPARRRTFAAALREAGFKVTLRYSLGSDIAAACGQLVRRENRRLAIRSSEV